MFKKFAVMIIAGALVLNSVPTGIAKTGILNKSKLSLKIGQTSTVKSKKKVKWSMSGSAAQLVKAMAKKAKVKAVKSGSSTLTATYLKKKYKVKITVAKKETTKPKVTTSTATPAPTLSPSPSAKPMDQTEKDSLLKILADTGADGTWKEFHEGDVQSPGTTPNIVWKEDGHLKKLGLKNVQTFKGTIDLSAFTALEDFSIDGTLVTEIKASLPSLKTVDMGLKYLDNLILSGCTSLESLKVNHQKLKDEGDDIEKLDLSGCTAIKELDIGYYSKSARYRGAKEIDLSGCTSLEKLSFGGWEYRDAQNNLGPNNPKKITFKNNKALKTIYANPGCSLDFSECPELEEFKLEECDGVKEINLSNNKKLKELEMTEARGFEKLDVSDHSLLSHINLSETQVKTLNASKCVNLLTLGAVDGRLETLDVSGCEYLSSIDVRNNYVYNDKNEIVYVGNDMQLSLKKLDFTGLSRLTDAKYDEGVEVVGYTKK